MQHPLYGCLWVKLMHRCMFVSVCFCRIYLFTFDLHFLFLILPLPPLLACFPEQTDLCCLTEIFRSVLKEMEMLYHCLQCKCQSRDLPLMRQHPYKIENFVLELLAVLKTLICCFWVSMKMYSEASCHFSLLMHMYASEPGLLKASAQTGRKMQQNLVLNVNPCPNSLISFVLLAFMIFVKPFELNCFS